MSNKRGRREPTQRGRQGIVPPQAPKTSNYTVMLTELEAQIEEVAGRRLSLSMVEVEARIDSGKYKLDEDNYELWSWLKNMVGSARAMRKRVQSVCTCG